MGSTRPDICVGANCAFPLDSGSAANFPSDCPCANKNVFYNMQEYTIDEDLLASWAGYDVILKIADEQTGDDGFVAVDNIKFHGKPLTCVELTGTGSPDWTAYSDSDALADPADTDSGPATDAYPAGGFGNNQGWSRITDPDGTYGYAAGTSSNCRMSSFNSVGDAGATSSCEYATCPAGSITVTQAMCLALGKSAADCTFPSVGAMDVWPSTCP